MFRGELKELRLMSCLELYERDITPKLKAIDLLLKCSEGEISEKDTAEILQIPAEDVQEIKEKLNIQAIDKKNFAEIMAHGTSPICQLLRRELNRSSPYIYSVEDLSYIYGIKPEIITTVCDVLDISQITTVAITKIFANIYIGRVRI